MSEQRGWYDLSPANPRRLQQANGYPQAKGFADRALVQLKNAKDLKRAVSALGQKQTYLFSQVGIDISAMEAKLSKKPVGAAPRRDPTGTGGK